MELRDYQKKGLSDFTQLGQGKTVVVKGLGKNKTKNLLVMKENWKKGKHQSQVVIDTPITNENFPLSVNLRVSHKSEVDYYGGYLVCESIGNIKHQNLIASAPDLLEALKLIYNEVRFDGVLNSTRLKVENAIKKAESNE